jgi:hypothetical protein
MAKLLTEDGKLETLATQEYVNARVGDAISGIKMPDVSGLAEKSELPDISNLATKSEVLAVADSGVPSGGTTGQILTKASNTDYDTEWITPDSVGIKDSYYSKVVSSAHLPDYIGNITGIVINQAVIFVKDEIWAFFSNKSNIENFGTCRRYVLNAEETEATHIGSFQHNWGHCNAVSYNEATDSIIVGSGSGDITVEGEAWVIEGISALKNKAQIDVREHGVKYDFPIAEWGIRNTAIWAESNGGREDIAYIITDNLQRFVKLQLGKGSNNLGLGTLIAGKDANQFNGTYRIVRRWEQDVKTSAIQNALFYDGKIYTGLSTNGGWWFSETTLLETGYVHTKTYRNFDYTETGEQLGGSGNTAVEMQSIMIRDGVMYLCIGAGGNITRKHKWKYIGRPRMLTEIPSDVVREAPENGKQYGRQNAKWTEIVNATPVPPKFNIPVTTILSNGRIVVTTGANNSTNQEITVRTTMIDVSNRVSDRWFWNFEDALANSDGRDLRMQVFQYDAGQVYLPTSTVTLYGYEGTGTVLLPNTHYIRLAFNTGSNVVTDALSATDIDISKVVATQVVDSLPEIAVANIWEQGYLNYSTGATSNSANVIRTLHVDMTGKTGTWVFNFEKASSSGLWGRVVQYPSPASTTTTINPASVAKRGRSPMSFVLDSTANAIKLELARDTGSSAILPTDIDHAKITLQQIEP